jgi:hypothetical protein
MSRPSDSNSLSAEVKRPNTQISGRQTPDLTRGSPPFYITNKGDEHRVKPGVWRPEMWAQMTSNDPMCLPHSSLDDRT